ncbi:MAG: isoprenylcysteine carboxylmethyltransferase family protein, partial [Vicinamibacterales bacterium]
MDSGARGLGPGIGVRRVRGGGGRRLGVQWSLVARVTDRHELITTGPYAIVRHPIYTAMLGLLIATGLTFGTPLSTATGLGLYVIGT